MITTTIILMMLMVIIINGHNVDDNYDNNIDDVNGDNP